VGPVLQSFDSKIDFLKNGPSLPKWEDWYFAPLTKIGPGPQRACGLILFYIIANELTIMKILR